MKLVSKNVDKNSVGQCVLVIENEEDVWLAYNLVQVGDSLKSSTIRKVQNETATGSVVSKQVRTTLTISVENVELDIPGSTLHVKGRNIEENSYVKMGAYHTLDLGKNFKFTLAKSEWDSVALEMLEQAADVTNYADVAAVVMQEGLAYVCLITNTMTIVRSKIDVSIPRKRKGLTSQHDKGLAKYFEQIMQAIERHIKFNVIKCVILASPGFVKDEFFEYMMTEATKQDKRVFLENKTKFLMIHSSSGHKYALKEVLQDPMVQIRMTDTKATAEVRALNDFYQMLKQDSSRAFYGVKHVEAAVTAEAVETLLVSDTLFRSTDLAQRKRYVAMVDAVKDAMGTVRIFSSLHISGDQLVQLSGIAAILRFPIPEPEDDSEDDSDTEYQYNS